MADKRGIRKKDRVFSKNTSRNQTNRYKKTFGNRAEGQGFADKRKKKIQYEYLAMLKKEKIPHSTKLNYDAQHSDEEEETDTRTRNPQNTEQPPSPPNKPRQASTEQVNRYTSARSQFLKKKAEKMKKKKEYFKKKEEREDALAAYDKKKKSRFKKLCKRNYKGQPIMKNQIEFLLEKIEKQVNQT